MLVWASTLGELLTRLALLVTTTQLESCALIVGPVLRANNSEPKWLRIHCLFFVYASVLVVIFVMAMLPADRDRLHVGQCNKKGYAGRWQVSLQYEKRIS
jgi:hypothetical protein